MSPRPAGSALIDVACPACGEVYHLRSDSVGKQVECVNKLCRQRFVVEPPASGPPAAEKTAKGPQMPEVVAAQPVGVAQTTHKPDAAAVNSGAGVPNALPAADDEAPPIQITWANANAAVRQAASISGVGVPPESEQAGETPAPQPSAGETPAPEARAAAGTPGKPEALARENADFPSLTLRASNNSPVTNTTLGRDPGAGRPKRRRGQPRWAVALEVVAAAALVLLASYVGVLQFQEWSKTPAEEWTKAQALYQEHKWNNARSAFSKYAEQFPQAPETPTVPFFLDLCAAGDEVYSPTGNLSQGMAALERLFRAHRDSPAYHEYAGDLFQALGRVIERSVDRAKQFSNLDDLEQAKKADDDMARARQAHELLHTVAEAMKDAWVPDRVEQLRQTIDKTAREVKLNLTRTEIVGNFRRVPGFPLEDDLASVYARIEELLHDEPELASDARVLKEQALAHRSEAARVRYHSFLDNDDEPMAEAPASANGKTLAVVWKPADQLPAGETPAPQIVENVSPVVVALAQGVLYAFDTTGKPLWARRLGLDVDRLPVRAAVGAAGGELLIVRSSVEKTLLALEASSGVVRWRFAAPEAMTAPVTLVTLPNQGGEAPLLSGFLPTADGRIYVLEPVLGNRLGYYETGWPLTVAGSYDPLTRRLFFAADFDRVLAIDPSVAESPKRPPCSSVLFTRHASGSLHSEPLVVGPYLVLLEGSDLDHSRLRAWSISEGGFADPDAAPLAEQTVSGWSWFAPQASPDRLLFATDRGELGLFGLNLDNQSEAIYRLVEDPTQPPSTALPGVDGTRTLLAYAQNQSLWVQAGASLRRLTTDVLDQQVKTAWSIDDSASATSIPLHEAQSREQGRRPLIYLSTMTADGNRFNFAAREAESGATVWQRQLGLRPVGSPVVADGRMLIADRSGRVAAISMDEESAKATTLIEPADSETLDGLFGAPFLIDDAAGQASLFARLAGTNDVAVRPLTPASDWQRLQPPAEVLGTPCTLDGTLVAACSDGLVHRLTANRSADVNEQPFVWFVGERPPRAAISLTPIGHETVLLCDGQSVRRLQYQVRDSVGQWVELGESYAADGKLAGRPLVQGEHIFVTKLPGIVEVLDAYNPAHVIHRWSLDGTPTTDLFVRAGQVMLVVDDELLVSLTAAADASADEPNWTSAKASGAICGQPLVHGNSFMVAYTSGTVRALDIDDGKTLWETKLGPGQAPSAAPAVLADRFLVVPLMDGTLTVAPLPVPSAEETERVE